MRISDWISDVCSSDLAVFNIAASAVQAVAEAPCGFDARFVCGFGHGIDRNVSVPLLERCIQRLHHALRFGRPETEALLHDLPDAGSEWHSVGTECVSTFKSRLLRLNSKKKTHQ